MLYKTHISEVYTLVILYILLMLLPLYIVHYHNTSACIWWGST